MALLNLGGAIAQFQRNDCSIPPVEVISGSGVRKWRIIRDDGACGNKWDAEKKGALLEMIRPSSIILGCMAKPEFEKAVREHCEECRINLYKMKKDKGRYRLEKVPVILFDD